MAVGLPHGGGLLMRAQQKDPYLGVSLATVGQGARYCDSCLLNEAWRSSSTCQHCVPFHGPIGWGVWHLANHRLDPQGPPTSLLN